MGCNFYRIKPELNNLPTTEKRFLLGKNSSEQVDDDWGVDYYSEGVYPNVVVNENAHAVLRVYISVNITKAVPHFLIDSKAGIEITQRAISIQLFKS
jgi:hypothetical protein